MLLGAMLGLAWLAVSRPSDSNRQTSSSSSPGDTGVVSGATDYNRNVEARAAGDDGSGSRTIVSDTSRPVATAPVQSFAVSSQLGTRLIPVKLTWSATDSGSGISRYQLQQSANAGRYADVRLPTATTTGITRWLAPDYNYRFRIRAQDRAGNWSAWVYGPRFTVAAYAETHGAIRYSGTWRRVALSGAYGENVKYATIAGHQARLTFTGRNVAWVASKGPSRGQARVYIDGTYVTTVDLYSETASSRRVVFARKWSTPAHHTLEVRVVGTAEHPRVDVDAFVVLHSDAVLVGAGDIASCSRTGDEATARLLDRIAGRVFTVGDNVYPDGTATQFADCYGSSWGRHKARTRPSVGNHEYHTAGASGYYNYFGAAAGNPSKGYYSYDIGKWHVVVLNTNCWTVGGCGVGSPQERWLRADLAAHPATCTLAYGHHPRYSSGPHGSQSFMQPIWQALYDYGADVLVSGHDHDYERFAPQDPAGMADAERGIRQFVVGTGGYIHYSIATPIANSQAHNDDTFGVLKLTLHPASYEWEFVPEAGKTYADSGRSACHP